MQILINNSVVKFRKAEVVTRVFDFGNDSEGIIVSAYLKGNGGVQPVASGTYAQAVSPLVDISKLIGDIKLQNWAQTDGSIVAAFYDSDGVTALGVRSRQSTEPLGGVLTISNGEIPSGTKYLRFNVKDGTNITSSSPVAGHIEFKAGV